MAIRNTMMRFYYYLLIDSDNIRYFRQVKFFMIILKNNMALKLKYYNFPKK